MSYAYLAEPAIFLIDTLAWLYILAIMLRFLLQWAGGDYYNPIAQVLIKITHPPLKMLRRHIPAIGKIDTASIVLAIALQMLADYTILLLKGADVSLAALVLLAFSELLTMLINVYVFAVFAGALLSWFNPGSYNAVVAILSNLTEPLLQLCRRFVPVSGGIDFSPVIVLIALELLKMLLLPPLQQLVLLLG